MCVAAADKQRATKRGRERKENGRSSLVADRLVAIVVVVSAELSGAGPVFANFERWPGEIGSGRIDGPQFPDCRPSFHRLRSIRGCWLGVCGSRKAILVQSSRGHLQFTARSVTRRHMLGPLELFGCWRRAKTQSRIEAIRQRWPRIADRRSEAGLEVDRMVNRVRDWNSVRGRTTGRGRRARGEQHRHDGDDRSNLQNHSTQKTQRICCRHRSLPAIAV